MCLLIVTGIVSNIIFEKTPFGKDKKAIVINKCFI